MVERSKGVRCSQISRPNFLAVRIVQNRQIIGTHTLKIRCVCTDESAVYASRNLLKIKRTEAFPRVCYIGTTTLDSVSSRTHPHMGRAWSKVKQSLRIALRNPQIYTVADKFYFGNPVAQRKSWGLEGIAASQFEFWRAFRQTGSLTKEHLECP